jgi:hypothetical protein
MTREKEKDGTRKPAEDSESFDFSKPYRDDYDEGSEYRTAAEAEKHSEPDPISSEMTAATPPPAGSSPAKQRVKLDLNPLADLLDQMKAQGRYPVSIRLVPKKPN